MAVCYTNEMDDLVLLYDRVDLGSLHTYLYQKVELAVFYCCSLRDMLNVKKVL